MLLPQQLQLNSCPQSVQPTVADVESRMVACVDLRLVTLLENAKAILRSKGQGRGQGDVMC